MANRDGLIEKVAEHIKREKINVLSNEPASFARNFLVPAAAGTIGGTVGGVMGGGGAGLGAGIGAGIGSVAGLAAYLLKRRGYQNYEELSAGERSEYDEHKSKMEELMEARHFSPSKHSQQMAEYYGHNAKIMELMGH